MKMISFCSTIVFLSGLTSLSLPSARATVVTLPHTLVIDSLRIEKKDGKRFILHRVDEGQTLYAISRKYKRSVAEIKAANPDMKEAVRYDQLILIPVPDGALSRKEEKAIDKAIKKQEKEAKREAREREKETEKVADAKPVTKAEKASEKEVKKPDDPAQSGIHVVEVGQTLYSLANRYGVSQADIRKWNNLPGNNVLIGQPLIVSEKAYLDRTPSNAVAATKSTETPSRPTPSHPVDTNTHESRPHDTRPTTRTEPKPDHRNETDTPTRTSAPGTKPAEPEPEPPRPGNDAPMPTQGRRISSSGVAEMIDGTDGSGKFLALHRTAPIGTLVQVRNEFNNQSLWVKVIGRLPNTGINDKILIKLSSQAFAKLSPEDRRFRAEVSYIVK